MKMNKKMIDGLNDIARAEKELREEAKEYCIKIITADIDGKLIERKRKDGNTWKIFPRGKYNFNKYDYRIKE